VTCRQELEVADKRCPTCGKRVRPGYVRPLITATLVGVLLVALNTGVHRIDALAKERGVFEVEKDSAPAAPKRHRTATTVGPATSIGAGPKTTTTLPVPAQPLIPVSAEATSVAEAAQNGCGQSTSYEPSQLLDGDPNTAWRAVGDGRWVKIVLTLSEAKRITEVGLIPGYDKTDQCTGIDRFVQMRRIKKVRWSFDDGTTTEQTFSDERSMQSTPVDAVSAHITVEVLATTAAKELDYTAISDIHVAGRPA
jgi:hypothetical protein